jgi:hypothetical protein
MRRLLVAAALVLLLGAAQADRAPEPEPVPHFPPPTTAPPPSTLPMTC